MNTIELIKYLEDSFPITTSINSENASTIFLAGYEIRGELATLYFISIARKGIIDTIIITFFVGNTDNLDKIRSKIISEILYKLKKKVHIPNSFIFEIAEICKEKDLKIETITRNGDEDYYFEFEKFTPKLRISRCNMDTEFEMSVIGKNCKSKTFNTLEELKEGIINFIDGLYEGEIRC